MSCGPIGPQRFRADIHLLAHRSETKIKFHKCLAVLIVAYGNPLRSDDGVAWRAAAALQKTFPPERAEILTLHQLGPELAENASRSECVIFVDAAAGPGRPGEIQVRELSESDSDTETSALLSRHVAARMCSRWPRSSTSAGREPSPLSVVGKNFNHGESLSPAVEAALPALLARIEELATQR